MYVQNWQHLQSPRPVLVAGREAELLALRAGGSRALVRFPEGTLDVQIHTVTERSES